MAYEEFALRNPWPEFGGGLNTQELAQYIGEDQSPDMLNQQPYGKGGYMPRFGITAVGDIVDPSNVGIGRSLYTFLKPNLELLIRTQTMKLQYLDDFTNPLVPVWTSLPAVRAGGLIVMLATLNVVAGNQVTLGSVTYTYVTTINNSTPNQVLVLGDGKPSMQNLVDAINNNPSTSGVAFSSATVANPVATATNVSTDNLVTTSQSDQRILINAITPGAAGNSIALHTTSGSNLLVFAGPGTLAGGLDQNSYSNDRYVGFANDTQNLWIGNASDSLESWNGDPNTPAQAYPFAPKGNLLLFVQGRLCIAGSLTGSTVLAYSKPGFPSDFSNTVPGDGGTIDFADDGDPITALRLGSATNGGSTNKNLYVIKKSTRVYEVVFYADKAPTYSELVTNTGAVNTQSTVTVDNDIWYIDPGNNIASLGKRADILNDVRTDPQTIGISRTTPYLDFSNACGIFFKKLRMIVFSMKSYGSVANDVQLVYFQDYGSWWPWKGLNANQYAIYKGEMMWCSSIDLNVYKYDETSFSDNGNPIISYRVTPATEAFSIIGRAKIIHRDQYKQARFAIIRGLIPPQGKITLKAIYDQVEDPNGPEIVIDGSNDAVTVPGLSVTFGRVIFGLTAPFGGGSSNTPVQYQFREFLAILSLDEYTWMMMQLKTSCNEIDAPYIVSFMTLWISLLEPEKFTEEEKL